MKVKELQTSVNLSKVIRNISLTVDRLMFYWPLFGIKLGIV